MHLKAYGSKRSSPFAARVGGEEVVHLAGDEVGVPIRGAEDDGLLPRTELRPIGATVDGICKHLLEEIAAHRFHAVGQDDLLFEVACVITVGDLLGRQGLASVCIGGVLLNNLGQREASGVEVHQRELNIHRGQVPILHGLTDFVFVDGFAKVFVVVRRQFEVALSLIGVLGRGQLAGRGS